MGKKPFLSIDYTKPGKGVKKGSSTLFTFSEFFALLKRKIWELIKCNLLWVVMCLPLIFGFYTLSGNLHTALSTPVDFAFPLLAGVELFEESAALALLKSVAGIQTTVLYPGTLAKVFYAITALTLFTFGPANAGLAYMTRGYTKEEYVDMPSDFFRTIKKNLVQSILVGLFDVIIMAMILFSLTFYMTNSSVFIFSVSFFVTVALAVVYLMARFYLYPLLVTFKLSVWKIFKNSVIFALIGIKRNIVGLLGVIFVLLLNLLIYIYALPLGGILPFFITIALVSFISTYSAWPNIKRIMIDPYYKDNTKEQDNGDEPIFKDRG